MTCEGVSGGCQKSEIYLAALSTEDHSSKLSQFNFVISAPRPSKPRLNGWLDGCPLRVSASREICDWGGDDYFCEQLFIITRTLILTLI